MFFKFLHDYVMANFLVIILTVFLWHGIDNTSVACALEVNELNVESNIKESTGLSQDELNRFRHLGKLGEQGKILHGEIHELDYFPNGKDFYDNFVRKRRPLIIRGAAKQWPAFEYWKNESYMREKYGDVLFEVDFTKTYEQKFPIKKTLKLNEFFDIYKSQEVYLDSAFPQSNLTKDIPVPFCLQCEEISSKISSIHLLYSNGGTSYVLHQDGYENILTVLSGRKILLITNSSYSARLHSDEYITVPGLSPIDPEKVDLVKYPGVADVPFHKVILEAGDALYNPQLWWHQVRSYDSPNIGISLWFSQFTTQFNVSTEDVKMEEVAKHAAFFEDSVKTFPETIACRNQNQPLGTFYWPVDDKWDSPSLEKYKMGMKKLKMLSGYEIPLLGFGTGFLTEEAKLSTLTALKSGYRLFDTAVAYNNEEDVGEAIALSGVPREEIVIVDKIHPKDYYTSGATIRSVQQSLEKLKVDYIDVMLLHATDCEEEGGRLSCSTQNSSRTWEDAWYELEATVDQGKVRSIGVSNFEANDLQRLWEIAHQKPSIVQNLFDPFIQDVETRQFCEAHGIVYMGYSTLGRSWSDLGLPYNPVFNNSVLSNIAASYDASIAQVVLRWAMWENVVVVPRSSNFNHIVLNFAAQYVPLNARDVYMIRELRGQIDEDELAEAIEKTYSHDKSKAEAKTAIIENPSIVVEREVDIQKDIVLYFGSDDHWIYAVDGINGTLLWKHQTADETGSVCMTNGNGSTVYCGADDEFMRAFHASNGSLEWKFRTGGAVTSSVRISELGYLYFGCLDHHLYCVTSSGDLRWKMNVGLPVWATPALASGGKLVFIGGLAEEPGEGMAYALDGETGSIVWSSVIGGIFASPAVDEQRNIVVFCTVHASCYGIRMDSGEKVWKLEVQSEVYSSPSLNRATGMMYIACLQGTFYAIYVDTGRIHWKKSVFIPEIRSSPLVLDDGRIFLATGGGMVLHMNSKNGDVIWSKNIDDAEIFSSPKLAADLLYVGTIRGEMVALNVTTGEVVWSFRTNGPVVATVRINSNRVVYTGERKQFNE